MVTNGYSLPQENIFHALHFMVVQTFILLCLVFAWVSEYSQYLLFLSSHPSYYGAGSSPVKCNDLGAICALNMTVMNTSLFHLI